MKVSIKQLLRERRTRGHQWMLEVFHAGRAAPWDIEIDERAWLLACDRWPADPAMRSAAPEGSRPCC